MESRQGHGTRQHKQTTSSSSSSSSQQQQQQQRQKRSNQLPKSPAASSAATSLDVSIHQQGNAKTHRRQTSEPASLSNRQLPVPPGTSKLSTLPRTDASKPSNSKLSSSSYIPQATKPQSHQSHPPPSSRDRQSSSSSVLPQPPSSSSLSSSSSQATKYPQNVSKSSSSSNNRSSQPSKRTDEYPSAEVTSAGNDDIPSGATASSGGGSRLTKAEPKKKKQRGKEDESKVSTTSESESVKSRPKEGGSKTSTGKPSQTPKIKRKPRSSSKPRQQQQRSPSADDTSSDRQSSSAKSGAGLASDDLDLSSSSCQDTSASSRLLPEEEDEHDSSSSSPRRRGNLYDKITSGKEQQQQQQQQQQRGGGSGDRKNTPTSSHNNANGKDSNSDTRSVKSDKSSRSKRAASAPREGKTSKNNSSGNSSISTLNGRGNGNSSSNNNSSMLYDNATTTTTTDEKKSSSSYSKGSISYHQLPKYDGSKFQSTSTMQQSKSSSKKKHNSLSDVSGKSNLNEGAISMKELSATANLDRYNKIQRQTSSSSSSYAPVNSSSSVRNHNEPSKTSYNSSSSRSDHDNTSSTMYTKSPRNASSSSSSRKQAYSSDAEMKSDSERSHRGTSVSSAEEPLLPKSHHHRTTSSSSSNSYKKISTDSQSESGRALLPSPNIHTFPRMKQQRDNTSPSHHHHHHHASSSSSGQHPMMSAAATMDRHQTGKTQFLLDRKRNFSSNSNSKIPSNESSYFSPLHKIPSQSSMASSETRSEVCLDLPDMPEDNDDYYTAGGGNSDYANNKKVKMSFPSVHYEPIVYMSQRSVCKSILIKCIKAIVSFVLFWPLLVLLIVIVPLIWLVKRSFSLLCCCRGRCCVCVCHTHLSSGELAWLGGRGSRANPVVQCLVVLQRGLDTERIRHLINSRVLYVENRRGRKLYPRFTQKISNFCCGQAWVSDKSFVTANHIFDMPAYIETLDDLQQFISKMASEPLPMRHPLWEVQVLQNFREPRDTVLLFRMHMCMTDGVSMVHVLQHALVDSQKPISSKTSFSDDVANTSIFKVLLAGPLTFLSRYVFRRNELNLLHGSHYQPSGETVVAWSEPFSLSAALRVKQVARCTLADLLLSITAGNIRTYLQVCGIRHPNNVTCAVPVDLQSLDSTTLDMENKFVVVNIPLPTNTEGAIPRLWMVKNIMEKFKGSAEAAVVNGTRWLASSLLPRLCFQRLWGKIHNRCTLLVSNLSGPTSVLKLDSREIKCMMYWVPPLEKVAVTISFFTYADQIRMSVISDRSALPNPELLTRDFIYKLETLSKLLAHRRIPGESAYSSRHENVHLLSSFTLEDLTADQIQLEMSLVQQELHDLKFQLDSGSSHHISHNDTQLIERIEALKERSSELMMQLRRRKAEETECAVVLSEEADDLSFDLEGPPKNFRRRTLSVSSRMSTTSVTSTARPLSTASTSNLASTLPSPTHHSLPSWPEADLNEEDYSEEGGGGGMKRPMTIHRFPHRPDPELDSPEHQNYHHLHHSHRHHQHQQQHHHGGGYSSQHPSH